MQLFWRENCLHIEPADAKERAALLLLTEQDGIRNTCSAKPVAESQHGVALEIEVSGPAAYITCPHCRSTSPHEHWTGRIPAIPDLECIGTSESDAFAGTMIEGLRRIAQRLESCWEVPLQVETWFQRVRAK
jgi:hypothetical protein